MSIKSRIANKPKNDAVFGNRQPNPQIPETKRKAKLNLFHCQGLCLGDVLMCIK